MGKRKERRLAALNNAGRRVKLDLFVEPSGELGGSIVHEEVGGDPKDTAVLPNSPSSSGGFRQFSSKGLYREGMSARTFLSWEYGTVCTRHIILFSDCRVAVVLGTFRIRSDQALPQ